MHLRWTAILFAAFLAGFSTLGSAQDAIILGVSLPQTSPLAIVNIVGSALQGAITAAIAEDNDRLPLGPCNRKVSLLSLDDKNDEALILENYRRLAANTSVVAVFPSANINHYIAALVANITNSTLPFLSPYSGEITLFEPFVRSTINLRPSYRDETGAILNFLTNVFLFSRIAFVYSNDIYGESPMRAALRLLPELGLIPVSVNVVDDPLPGLAGRPTPQSYFDAVRNITATRPQAVVVFGLTATMATLVSAAAAMETPFPSDLVFMTGSLGGPLFSEWFKIWNVTAPRNVFISSPVPALSSTTSGIIAAYHSAKARYANDTADVDIVSPMAYAAARFVLELLRKLGPERNFVTPRDLLDLVYRSPMTTITDDFVFGPFVDSDSDTAAKSAAGPLCNVGRRVLYILKLRPDGVSMETLWNSTFSWEKTGRCSAITDDVRLPYVFGTVSMETAANTSVDAVSRTSPAVDAIVTAFAENNDDGSLLTYGRKVRLIASEYTESDNVTDLLSITSTLLTTNNVVGMLGFNRAATAAALSTIAAVDAVLVAPTTGAEEFRRISGDRSELRQVVHIRVSWNSELTSAARYYATVRGFRRIGLFAPDNADGRSAERRLEDAVNGYLGDSASLWQPLLRYDTDNPLGFRLPEAMSSSSGSPDVIVAFCPDQSEACIRLLELLSRSRVQPHVVHLLWAFDSNDFLSKMHAFLGWFSAATDFAEPPFEVILSSSYPSPWQPSSTLANATASVTDTDGTVFSTVISAYSAALARQAARGGDVTPSLESLEGYIAGHFLLAVIAATPRQSPLATTNGSDVINATRVAFADAIYSQQTFRLFADYALSGFADECVKPVSQLSTATSSGSTRIQCCNQGGHSVYFLRLHGNAAAPSSGPYWQQLTVLSFVGCSATFPGEESTSSTSDSSNDATNANVAIITGTVIGGVGLAGAGVLVFVFQRRYRKRAEAAGARPRPRQPDFNELALDSSVKGVLERTQVEQRFLEALPTHITPATAAPWLDKIEEVFVGNVLVAKWLCRTLLSGRHGNAVEPSELATVVCILFHSSGAAADLLGSFAAEEIRDALSGFAESAAADPNARRALFLSRAGGFIHTSSNALTKLAASQQSMLLLPRGSNASSHPPTGLSQTSASANTISTARAQVLFRQDDFLSKLYKVFVRLVGLPWLWNALAEFLDEIEWASTHTPSQRLSTQRSRSRMVKRKDAKGSTSSSQSGSSADDSMVMNEFSLEIDPQRAKEGDDLIGNALQLKLVAHRIVLSLTESATEGFPLPLREFLTKTREALTKASGGSLSMSVLQPVVAAFVFLRFVCPAVTSPHTHGLFRAPPTAAAQRFLVLLSKVLINVATGVSFGEKEQYMAGLNELIAQHVDSVRAMLDSVSSKHRPSVMSTSLPEPPKHPVKITPALKRSCLKTMYYYIAMHQLEIEEAAREAEESGTIDERASARTVLQLMRSVGILEQTEPNAISRAGTVYIAESFTPTALASPITPSPSSNASPLGDDEVGSKK